MKHIAFLLIAAAWASEAFAQALPDSPQPADVSQSSSAPPTQRVAGQSMWDRMGRLPRGQKIKIRLGNGRWDHCVFAGLSEEYLFCAYDDGSGLVQESQINRVNVAEFKLDHDVRNGRLIFTAVTVGTGLGLGIHSIGNRNGFTPEASGVIGGLIGAGMGALAGMPLSCISGHCVGLPHFDSGPAGYWINVNVPLRRIPHHARR